MNLKIVVVLTETSIQSKIESDGFVVLPEVLNHGEIDELIAALDELHDGEQLLRQGRIFAVRNLLDVPRIRDLAESESVLGLAKSVLGDAAFPVRGILFDKIPEANWKVPWHQDVTIAVQEKADVAGFGPWSTKAGILHVQPPASVLEKMISIRLHLDACTASNGALQVVPGSHRSGRIPEVEIPSALAVGQPHVCAVERGGALLMRPLLLHASSPSLVPQHRRVIHLDYACEPLPSPLHWLSEPLLQG